MSWGTNKMRNSLQRWPAATIRNNISYNLPNDDKERPYYVWSTLRRPPWLNILDQNKQTKTPTTKETSSPRSWYLVERYLGLARSRQSSMPAQRHNKWANQSVPHLYHNRPDNLHPKRRRSLLTATIYECSPINITKSVKFTTHRGMWTKKALT